MLNLLFTPHYLKNHSISEPHHLLHKKRLSDMVLPVNLIFLSQVACPQTLINPNPIAGNGLDPSKINPLRRIRTISNPSKSTDIHH